MGSGDSRARWIMTLARSPLVANSRFPTVRSDAPGSALMAAVTPSAADGRLYDVYSQWCHVAMYVEIGVLPGGEPAVRLEEALASGDAVADLGAVALVSRSDPRRQRGAGRTVAQLPSRGEEFALLPAFGMGVQGDE
jgi:hypothetical protein